MTNSELQDIAVALHNGDISVVEELEILRKQLEDHFNCK